MPVISILGIITELTQFYVLFTSCGTTSTFHDLAFFATELKIVIYITNHTSYSCIKRHKTILYLFLCHTKKRAGCTRQPQHRAALCFHWFDTKLRLNWRSYWRPNSTLLHRAQAGNHHRTTVWYEKKLYPRHQTGLVQSSLWLYGKIFSFS